MVLHEFENRDIIQDLISYLLMDLDHLLLVPTLIVHEIAIGPHADILHKYPRALRKTSHILVGLSHLTQYLTTPVTYYALDLERRELERTLNELTMSEVGSILEGKVDVKGMLGKFDDPFYANILTVNISRYI